jgi:stearoyl-CoA desaturase (delta-9 desaturase)
MVETTAGYEFSPGTCVLFCAVAAATVIGVPLFGMFYGFSLVDWITFVILYIVTGMGITVGYHRLIAHRSFECHPWVKVALLIAGGWALQNSALVWCADHIRHHARTDQEEDPYNATKGFWHSHCGWIFLNRPTEPTNTRSRFGKTR